MTLAEKLNPLKFNYSPKMTAIVGAIIGHDYGARDPRGNLITGLNITPDGFVIGETDSPESSPFIGTAADLERNLIAVLTDANLTPDEKAEYERLYVAHVTDWRTR